jgi:hypothetical protein
MSLQGARGSAERGHSSVWLASPPSRRAEALAPALTVVPVIALLAIRKPLARAHEVLELRDGLLWVLALGAVHVAVKHAPAHRQLSSGAVPLASTHGYPSTRMRIKAYASGLKPDDTQRWSDWPTCVSCCASADAHACPGSEAGGAGGLTLSTRVTLSTGRRCVKLERSACEILWHNAQLTCCQRSDAGHSSPWPRQRRRSSLISEL